MNTMAHTIRGCASAQSRAALQTKRQSRRLVSCKAEVDSKPAATSLNSVPVTKVAAPEWVPEQVVPVLDFLSSDNFKLQESELYQKYLQKYLENEYVVQFTGFKKDPEIINGRAAMIGFVAAAGAEIFGAGSFLLQLSKFPQPVLVVLALITAGSVIPVVKGTKGEYLASLRDTYTLPDGVFTESLERLHGRLAMLGLSGLLAFELVKGSALL